MRFSVKNEQLARKCKNVSYSNNMLFSLCALASDGRMSSTGAKQSPAGARKRARRSWPRGDAQACLYFRQPKPYVPREKHDEFSGRRAQPPPPNYGSFLSTSGKDLGGRGRDTDCSVPPRTDPDG